MILLCLVLPACAFSQIPDSMNDSKWVNYKRVRVNEENSLRYFEDKRFVTENGDTLTRSLARSKATHNVISETSYLHNKKNGLEVTYFQNGVIEEINYYLDGKLWETISRSDSNGRLLNPGTLHNGNGTIFFTDYHSLDSNCFETFSNGLPEGLYYQPIGSYTAVMGNLTHKKNAVNYFPAKRIVFQDSSGRKYSEVYKVSLFKEIYPEIRKNTPDEILAVQDDSVEEDARNFDELSIGFSDPATIPRGSWKVFNFKTGKTFKSIDYDNSGNPIRIIAYNEDGTVSWQRQYPPCTKRKILKRNPDGSLADEACPDKVR